MERLVPPHAPVGPLNGCVLPIHWEFPSYTSFQSWRPQKRSFIFLLKSITNLENGVEASADILPGLWLKGFLFGGRRKQNLFRWVLWSWWLIFEAENMRAKANMRPLTALLPLLHSELTDRRLPQLPCLTALFRGLWKLPSSLFLKLNVWLDSQRMVSAHQRIKHAHLKMRKDTSEKETPCWSEESLWRLKLLWQQQATAK